ncbi:hypothetical protein EDC04DRAFT_2566167, partial [Pisolithus marmoratus]
ARKNGLNWVWIDTCCINKESSSELSEAINSMYKWYANADYVTCTSAIRLETLGQAKEDRWPLRSGFREVGHSTNSSQPNLVHFFDQEWERTGEKAELADVLSRITQIP